MRKSGREVKSGGQKRREPSRIKDKMGEGSREEGMRKDKRKEEGTEGERGIRGGED